MRNAQRWELQESEQHAKINNCKNGAGCYCWVAGAGSLQLELKIIKNWREKSTP